MTWLTFGCNSSQPTLVTLLISGDTRGWITPCGCAANQSGGLARRATLKTEVEQFSKVLLLDVGGSAVGTSEYQRMRLTYLLHGLAQMNLAAHNIGGPETAFSPIELREIGSATNTNWLNSNLQDMDGEPIGNCLLHKTIGGLKIDIAGVVAPELVQHSKWKSSDPVQSVVKAMKDSKADVRVVLAYLDEDGLRNLASALPEVDYIIGGPTGQTISPTRVGKVTILSATNKGKFLGNITFEKSSSGVKHFSSSISEVTSSLTENSSQISNLNDYHLDLSKRDFTSSESGVVQLGMNSSPGYSIAGSDSCTNCHKLDDSVWHQSKHSHAWDVLVLKNSHFDPDCQRCHTTGYGIPNGFTNVLQSPNLVNVGCENCHGPSQAHVTNPKKRTPFQAKQQCAACHDHENSPTFQWETYWAKITHAGGST